VKVEDVGTHSRQSSEIPCSIPLPPSYDGDGTRQTSARAQHLESEDDDFGTIVTEVTTNTTVITTRKKYRVEDA